MDYYFNLYKEMISLRGLSDHTLKSYCTYIRSYLAYLQNILHKQPEDVFWQELRDYIRWIQKERNLADRTINCAISQLRFFPIYVLHKPWDGTQIPKLSFTGRIGTSKSGRLLTAEVMPLNILGVMPAGLPSPMRGSSLHPVIWFPSRLRITGQAVSKQ